MSNELKLYHSAASPNSRRVRIFLAEKGIAIPLVPVDLAEGEQHSDAYRAIALLSPASTYRTMASRPFAVREAFLWLFIWSLRGTLKLRNLSFLGSDQMDNLLKDHN